MRAALKSFPWFGRHVLTLRRGLMAPLLVWAVAGCGNGEQESVGGDGGREPPAASASVPAEVGNTPSVAPTEEEIAPVDEIDQAFAALAFGSNIAQVQASRLAAEKTLSEDVRQYAQEMVKDHTAANEELMGLAKSSKLDLPTAPYADYKAALQNMNMVTGPQHDRFYMENFGVRIHENMLEAYEREVREGRHPELQRYAERRIPTLRQHLERAQQIRQGVDATH